MSKNATPEEMQKVIAIMIERDQNKRNRLMTMSIRENDGFRCLRQIRWDGDNKVLIAGIDDLIPILMIMDRVTGRCFNQVSPEGAQVTVYPRVDDMEEYGRLDIMANHEP